MKVEVRRHSAQEPWTYAELDAYQKKIAERVRAGEPGVALLSEVAPVITLGRRTGESDFTLAQDLIRARGIEIYPVDRGGLATYHGPGQWVVFVVERLDRLTGDALGVRKAVKLLLTLGAKTCERFHCETRVSEREPVGLWTPQGKLGALGISIQGGVLQHGFALNVLRTPLSFYGINPCGLGQAPVFLEDFALQRVEMGAVGEVLRQLTSELVPG